VPSAGRPRRFEEADELRLLFDAAFAVMQEAGSPDVTVAEILKEAGMSTRSFYRHFASKDELLLAMYRREAEAASARLLAAVEATTTPAAALEAWIDAILSIGHSRRRAARAAVLGSASAAKADGYGDEARYAVALLAEPLEGIILAGVKDGSFPAADPAADASLIQAMTWGAAGLNPIREVHWTRDQARAAVLSFARRALGAQA
jgi:AcrR family transcriptional regulator